MDVVDSFFFKINKKTEPKMRSNSIIRSSEERLDRIIVTHDTEFPSRTDQRTKFDSGRRGGLSFCVVVVY